MLEHASADSGSEGFGAAEGAPLQLGWDGSRRSHDSDTAGSAREATANDRAVDGRRALAPPVDPEGGAYATV